MRGLPIGWTREGVLDGTRSRIVLNAVVVLLFGAWSVVRGADVNEDLYNYHLYNAFALLHGKLGIDLAPAGLQGYFNPLLDVPYYVLNTVLPGSLVGFVYGALHGLSFCLLFAIVDRTIVVDPPQRRSLVVASLAAAGVLTSNFLSEVGDSMGDVMTALPTLAALALLLRGWPTLHQARRASFAILLAAGALVGASAGLKLTNALYVVALFVALMVRPSSHVTRLRSGALYGCGVLVGLLATGGYWLWTMWSTFGNPLFPQFSRMFPNPLVAPTMVMDRRYLPRSVWDAVAWPFILSIDPARVGPGDRRQVIWAIVYALLLLWTIGRLRAHRRGSVANSLREASADDGRSNFLFAFVVAAFLLWAALFSIDRYLITAELLAPLTVFLLLTELTRDSLRARRLAIWLLVPATCLVVFGGVPDLGHARWRDPAFAAETPVLREPERTSVLLPGDRPFSWIATFFPPTTAFFSVNGNFPASAQFRAELRRRVVDRAGPIFALIDGVFDGRAATTARANRIVDALGLTRRATGCAVIGWAVARFHMRAELSREVPATGDRQCVLTTRAQDRRDIGQENAIAAERARANLSAFGFMLAPQTCVPYEARVGDQVTVYQFCGVQRPAPLEAERQRTSGSGSSAMP